VAAGGGESISAWRRQRRNSSSHLAAADGGGIESVKQRWPSRGGVSGINANLSSMAAMASIIWQYLEYQSIWRGVMAAANRGGGVAAVCGNEAAAVSAWRHRRQKAALWRRILSANISGMAAERRRRSWRQLHRSAMAKIQPQWLAWQWRGIESSQRPAMALAAEIVARSAGRGVSGVAKSAENLGGYRRNM